MLELQEPSTVGPAIILAVTTLIKLYSSRVIQYICLLLWEEITKIIIFTEVNGGFGIIETPKDVIIGDNITLTCGASIYNFTSNINWFDKDDNQVNQTSKYLLSLIFEY